MFVNFPFSLSTPLGREADRVQFAERVGSITVSRFSVHEIEIVARSSKLSFRLPPPLILDVNPKYKLGTAAPLRWTRAFTCR